MILGPRPADNPANPQLSNGAAVYIVGSFHTHPPLTYGSVGLSRAVGPSQGDTDADNADDVAGVIYDYIGSGGSIMSGHDPFDPYRFYFSGGPVRRSTPR